MAELVAHIVLEGGLLTEPFIARRVAADIMGFRSEQWSEAGSVPQGIELVRPQGLLSSVDREHSVDVR